jgi:hypothetical protein
LVDDVNRDRWGRCRGRQIRDWGDGHSASCPPPLISERDARLERSAHAHTPGGRSRAANRHPGADPHGCGLRKADREMRLIETHTTETK